MARTGRPPKAPEKGRRQNYTFRMSDQTRDSVIEAAALSGRSMSEELEARIEASFRDDDMRTAVREEVRAALTELAETAEERAKGYLREALTDPVVKAKLHRQMDEMCGPAAYHRINGEAGSWPAGYHTSGFAELTSPLDYNSLQANLRAGYATKRPD